MKLFETFCFLTWILRFSVPSLVVLFNLCLHVCVCVAWIEGKEKTTGRRRSTTRRKSNTNPEPDPTPSENCLSPGLDPAPTVVESSPEPPPSAEKEEIPIPAPGALLPAPRPLEEPQPTPLLCSLDLGPGHSPASSPGPPVPLQSNCNPSMETEVNRASPIEQSPVLSPCSSPVVSPCPHLEDEDSLSPLFQRCLSDDSGGSPTPSLGHPNRR